MKKWILLLFLAPLAGLAMPAQAQTLKGNFHLGGSPSAIGLRELHDGNWLAGVEYSFYDVIWNNSPILTVNAFTAWRVNRGDPAYGPSLSVNMGQAGGAIGNFLGLGAPGLYNQTTWLFKLADLISIDSYIGYRPVHSQDVHSWIYGIGGKVKIPFDLSKGL
jgi:hypothetical protein